MKIRIGDAVEHKWRVNEGVGIVVGIAKFQAAYRLHGIEVLWPVCGVMLEHPGDVRMVQSTKDESK